MITFRNINDARKSTNLVDGETVFIQSHTKENIGGGHFVFTEQPIFFTLEKAIVDYDYDDFPYDMSINNSKRVIKVTPLNKSLGADLTYGTKLCFDNGVKGIVVANTRTDVPEPYFGWQRAYGKDSEEIRLIVDGELPKGSKAYYLDDNGSYINNRQLGYLERLNPSKTVIPEYYGAIPNDSIYDKDLIDNYEPLQNCFDSFFEVYIPSNYYTSQELFIRVNKKYQIKGYDKSYNVLTDRRSKYIAVGSYGCIFTDNNELKSVITIVGNCDFYGRVDVSLCKNFTNSAVRVLASTRFKGQIKADIVGNTQEIYKEGIGGDALLIDAQNVYEEGDILTNNGHITGCEFHINAIGFKHPFRHTKIAENINTFTNNFKVIVYADYCKSGIWLEDRIDSTYFEGIVQSRDDLHSEVDGKYCNLIQSGSSYYNFQVWDYRSKQNSFDESVRFVESSNITLGPICLANEIYLPVKKEDIYTNKRYAPIVQDKLYIKSTPNNRELHIEATNLNVGRGVGFLEINKSHGDEVVSQTFKNFVALDADPTDFVASIEGSRVEIKDIPTQRRNKFVRVTGDLSEFEDPKYMPNPQRINGIICHSADNADFGFILFTDDKKGSLAVRKYKKGEWSGEVMYI